MNLNENSFVKQKYYRYPDASYSEIRNLIRKKYNLNNADVLLGNGSTEIISAIFLWAYLQKKKIFYPWPSYILYHELTQLYNADVTCIPMDIESWNVDTLISTVTKDSLLLLCNPNNPTGTFLKKRIVRKLISNLPTTTTVLIDEAYIEYISTDDEINGSVNEVEKDSNVIVVRTFSKYYGLAGLRIGYALLSKEFYQCLRPFLQLWNVSTPAVEAAIKCLSPSPRYKEGKQDMIKSRKQLQEILCTNGFNVLPSVTNFLCFTHPKIKDYVDYWDCKGFMINKLLPYQDSQLHGYIRLSIEHNEVMKKFYQSINDIGRIL
ncbi:histidinol-phosphate transaminase [Bacillus sp. 03113]|uniref:pyridoxal phosphate-dependent aminotransferase n=1 Tax=Bacillus sp. 03113 TaxID=2578211 RepID=UPI0015E89FEE|nr:histidinol-phosphate transaminase [Bacillus sp. 03113]